MKKKIEPITFYILLALTVLTISYIAYGYIKGKVDEEKVEFYYTNEYFNMKEFTKNGYTYKEDSTITDKSYTALFIAPSTGCGVCMGQFQIYNRLISETIMNEHYNRTLAVIDTNKNHAIWFARVNQLKINTIAEITDEIKIILIKYKEEQYEKQFIIIDNVQNRILLRIKVKAGITITYEEMKAILPRLLNNINENDK